MRLVSDTLLAAQYRLDGLVTLVDALHGAHQIAHQPEAAKQIALADRVFMTKIDMAAPGAVDALITRHIEGDTIRNLLQAVGAVTAHTESGRPAA